MFEKFVLGLNEITQRYVNALSCLSSGESAVKFYFGICFMSVTVRCHTAIKGCYLNKQEQNIMYIIELF